MEEAINELELLHGRLNGAIELLRVVSAASGAKLGIGYTDATWALWRYLSDISDDMRECLGRAALAAAEH